MNESFKSEHLKNKKKHFPSSVREWNNSIYVYNKDSLNSIPSTTLSVMNKIKIYFNSFNKIKDKKTRSKRLRIWKRILSSNRIYFSNGEFKHTNDKVLINLYIHNRQKYNYLSRLKRKFIKNILKRKKSINAKIINKLRIIYNRGLSLLKNNNKYLLIKTSNFIKDNPDYKIESILKLSYYISVFYRRTIKRSMRKLITYFLYKQLVYINKSKLNYTYLIELKSQLEKLYNKNVEFNLINLKSVFLNSDIMYEFIRLKLTRNRKKLTKFLNKIRDKITIKEDKIIHIKKGKYNNASKELILSDMRSNGKKLNKFVVRNLRYKHVTGFRLEARGRLTKRHTASRAISKLKYKGNLLNIDSSYRKISSVMLRGNMKSNLQYTKLHSKTKIGVFGLKGWISGD